MLFRIILFCIFESDDVLTPVPLFTIVFPVISALPEVIRIPLPLFESITLFINTESTLEV